jgi:adenine phosphoribosyltransferase
MDEPKKSWTLDEISQLVRDIADFPKPGVGFKDITPVLENPEAFDAVVNHFASNVGDQFEKIVAVESRGFVFGAALAYHMKKGLVLVRKPGKLPAETIKVEYDLEYGKDCLEMHRDSINPGERVIIIDDVLATGGTARAVEILCKEVEAEVVSHWFLMELAFLKGNQKLSRPYKALLTVD